MPMRIEAKDFAEDIEPEEFGDMLAEIAAEFGQNEEAFATFMQSACDTARNSDRMENACGAAEVIFKALEDASCDFI